MTEIAEQINVLVSEIEKERRGWADPPNKDVGGGDT